MNQLKHLVDILDGYSFEDISYQIVHATEDNNLWNISIIASYNRVSEKLPWILDIVERIEGERGNENWKVQEIKKNNLTTNNKCGLYSLVVKYIGGNDEKKN